MRNFFKAFLIIVFVTLLLMFFLDNIYSYAFKNGQPRSRIQYILQLKNKQYDLAFFGSSRTEQHIDCKLITELPGKSCINFGTRGGSPGDMLILMKLAENKKFTFKEVFMQVDYNYNSSGITGQFKANLIPFMNNPIVNDQLILYKEEFFYRKIPFYEFMVFDKVVGVREAIESLNKTGETKLGILFRRCPVDFSDRYDTVLEKYKNLIVPVVPIWEQVGGSWNSVLPTQEDLGLQVNTILHTKAVVNLGSSMVFDFAVFDKPCLYLKYNVERKVDESWNPQKVYNFVHFRSMPTGKEVFWLRSKEAIGLNLETALENSQKTVAEAKVWFEKINISPAENASERIWEEIDKIAEKCT